MIVVKFGGASLAGTERMRAAARIVAALGRDQQVVCVVSAMAGVTDALIRATGQIISSTGEMTGQDEIAQIRIRHQQVIHELTTITATSIPATTPPDSETEWARQWRRRWAALAADHQSVIQGRFASEIARQHTLAAFSGWGERLAAPLFAAVLNAEGVPALALDGEPIVMEPQRASTPAPHSHDPLIAWEALAPSVGATRQAIAEQLAPALATGQVVVAPGYLARTRAGLVTTLGRNGSDTSAALLAAALHADALYIFSDVAGIRRADPRAVPDAEPLSALTYADGVTLAELGARVLHPGALRPLAAAGIPLRLRSAFAPDAAGTDVISATELQRLEAETFSEEPWVVIARPLEAQAPLLGLRAAQQHGLVEVLAVALNHTELHAREDDHLNAATTPVPVAPTTDAPGAASAVAVAGASALLALSPAPLSLSLLGRRVSAIVPIEQSVIAQRRLHAALISAERRIARRLAPHPIPRETADDALATWERSERA